LVNGMHWWIPWTFLAPTLFFVAALLIVPLLGGLLIAFTSWNVVSGLRGIRWTGVANFTEVLADPMFWESTVRTIVYAGASVPLTMALGLLLALALNRPQPGRAALRAIFFLPSLVNVIALGAVWLLLLNPESGVVNQTLRTFGLTDLPGWFTSQSWALPALILMSVWAGAGYTSVIYLAALQDMPSELYEAATIDGAGPLRRFATVTWPGLMPITTFLAITSFIGKSQGFGLIAYMTDGGPGDSTTVLSFYMYEVAFQQYRFGYAAAVGVMSLFGVLLLSLALWKLQRDRGLYT
jgi:ABC-type sugar transport system permease subunit